MLKNLMYYQKFFHPGPTVKRQTGFLVPHINNSNVLGSSLQIPYFYALSESKDFTFKPTLFDKNIYMFQNVKINFVLLLKLLQE